MLKHIPNQAAAKQQADNYLGNTPAKLHETPWRKIKGEAKVSNKILDETVPTQWLRVKGVPLLKREGHQIGGGTSECVEEGTGQWEHSWEYHADDWGGKRHDVDFDAYPWTGVASRVAGIVS